MFDCLKISEVEVDFVDKMGDDRTVVNAARVSMNRHRSTDEPLDEADARLLIYMAKHGHWSPFSHPQLSVRIQAPLFVARQLYRHQIGLTVNEISRRYVSTEPEFFLPEQFRKFPEHGIKQGSGGPVSYSVQSEATRVLEYAYQYALQTYNLLLSYGIAPEQARMVLPQAMMTQWYWTGSLYAFYRVVKLRIASDAQQETQLVAQRLNELLNEHFPRAYAALCETGV